MALLFSRAARRFQLRSRISILFQLPLSTRPQSPNPFDAPDRRTTNLKTLETHLPPWRRPWIGSPSHRSALGGSHCSLSLASVSSSSGAAEGGGSHRPQDGGGSPSDPSDASPSWIDLYLPASVRPYALLARLDKPIGTWLLAWPCLWSITMAASQGELPDMKMVALFGCGSVLLRGAGCTVNDLLDRDIDRKVARTRFRPFASGVLTPFQGLSFLGLQLLLGLGILLQLNNYRLTFWPQAYLGLTFNWGALLGWVAVTESLDPAIILPLYSAGVFWTLVYDTIYAHQDKEDDLKVGVKSTALRFGSLTKNWLTGFGIASIGSLTLSGYNAELAWLYYPFLMAAAGQLGWQILTVDLSDRADCNKKFASNKWFGALVFSGILFGRLAS